MIYELFTVLSPWVTLSEGLVRIDSLFSLLSSSCLGVCVGGIGDRISIWSSEEGR